MGTIALRATICFFLILSLNACGTYIPSLRQFPDDNIVGEDDMIASIIRTVNCELSYAVTEVVRDDQEEVQYRLNRKNYTNFLKDWGVEVAINLTINEKTSTNPTALLTPPASPFYAFSAALGVSASSEANRLQRMNAFYTVAELNRPDFFDEKSGGRQKCVTRDGNRHGSPLVNSDLRLLSLLSGRIGATTLGFAGPLGDKPLVTGEKNVLSQSVKFTISASGGITPSWTLRRATVNPAGTFFSTERDNIQELVFTFGPIDKTIKGARSLSNLAEATHLNTQLQTGIQSAITQIP